MILSPNSSYSMQMPSSFAHVQSDQPQPPLSLPAKDLVSSSPAVPLLPSSNIALDHRHSSLPSSAAMATNGHFEPVVSSITANPNIMTTINSEPSTLTSSSSSPNHSHELSNVSYIIFLVKIFPPRIVSNEFEYCDSGS